MLVLMMPMALCGERVMVRQAHEGNLKGSRGMGIVRIVHGDMTRAGLPTLAEGVASVSVRSHDLRAAAANRHSGSSWGTTLR